MIISVRLRLIYHIAAGLNNHLILNMKLYDFSHDAAWKPKFHTIRNHYTDITKLKTLKGLALQDILTEVHLYVHRG